MSTTCQEVYFRAKRSSPLNAEILSIPSEILARIEAEQTAVFASLAGVTRDRFQTSLGLTSSAAASGRVFDLSSLSPAVHRVLKLTLATGEEVYQVDVLDVDAELPPRYFVRGRTLVEVTNDWSATSGAVAATLIYVYGPTPISASGDYTQAISLPDEWADLLVLPLQKYFVYQRPVADRDANEVAAIDAQLAGRRAAFLDYLENFGGVESRRFVQPSPKQDSGKK